MSKVPELADENAKIADLISERIIAQEALPPLPRNLLWAILVAEDHRYFKHPGVDLISLLAVVWRFAVRRTISGASTIEQQLVRTLRGRYEFTVSRKASEILIALRISSRFQKLPLLKTYCEVAYFGWRANGVRQAATRLDFNLANLTDVQAATLAAMLKVPMPENPSDRYKLRLALRISYIMRRMKRLEVFYEPRPDRLG